MILEDLVMSNSLKKLNLSNQNLVITVFPIENLSEFSLGWVTNPSGWMDSGVYLAIPIEGGFSIFSRKEGVYL
jgi:hypothetical protein